MYEKPHDGQQIQNNSGQKYTHPNNRIHHNIQVYCTKQSTVIEINVYTLLLWCAWALTLQADKTSWSEHNVCSIYNLQTMRFSNIHKEKKIERDYMEYKEPVNHKQHYYKFVSLIINLFTWLQIFIHDYSLHKYLVLFIHIIIMTMHETICTKLYFWGPHGHCIIKWEVTHWV